MSNKKPKIAILHAFFKADCKGGGESLVLDIRKEIGADLFVGAIDLESWGPQLKGKDAFATKVWDSPYKFEYLHQDSAKPIWRQLKRQLNFLFNPKIKKLDEYDLVIFSGNVGFVPRRLKKAKKMMYLHTPPRPFTDQFSKRLKKIPFLLKPLIIIFKNFLLWQYKKDCQSLDYIVANSNNIKNRLQKYVGIAADEVIHPAIQTDKFKWVSQQDFFLSYGRLEELKRIPLIVDAFAKMPEKKLIIASGGPLKNWLEEEIKTRKIKNISYEGIVSDERLKQLVGSCLAGIYIPEDEDAGITQVEIMSAGKPVIGVKEGGLLETIIDGQTGILIKAYPETQNLIDAVNGMTEQKALSMKESSITQAEKFSRKNFFKKFNQTIAKLTK